MACTPGKENRAEPEEINQRGERCSVSIRFEKGGRLATDLNKGLSQSHITRSGGVYRRGGGPKGFEQTRRWTKKKLGGTGSKCPESAGSLTKRKGSRLEERRSREGGRQVETLGGGWGLGPPKRARKYYVKRRRFLCLGRRSARKKSAAET